MKKEEIIKERTRIEGIPHYEDCKSFKGGWCNCARLEMQMNWAKVETQRMKMPRFLQRFMKWYRPHTFPEA